MMMRPIVVPVQHVGSSPHSPIKRRIILRVVKA